MKTILVIVGAIVLFSQCMRDGLTPKSVSLNQATILQAKQSAILRTNIAASNGLNIRVDSIQDSRCPKEVACIWAGNAQVFFTTSKGQAVKSGTLCIGACGQLKTADTTQIELSGMHYDIILQRVDPYPTQTENQPAKTARLFVRAR
ncbi:hypothetical protein QNI16_00575 [Cytophagaceae bacterium YF14B1]|uniref:Uncharacterized protein n=1 Tax=Xanthocytophaga flava TaxID=3048013 RepID=A0AAE3U6T1_9BACT|nr:hypothetical protein [Xanthocytophaga flavus]MDJ1478954.1 hypothetical protein [Xanthocytophaga flavus]